MPLSVLPTEIQNARDIGRMAAEKNQKDFQKKGFENQSNKIRNSFIPECKMGESGLPGM